MSDDSATRLAYRLIVWAHSGRLVCLHPCPHGNPGCPLMDWLLEFDGRGWIDLFKGIT